MPSTFAVGDIHGASDLLSGLLTQLEGAASPEDRFVFLGDYIDRGPDSRGVIDQLLDFESRHPGRTTFLAGNHEHELLAAWEYPPKSTWPFFMEGLVTVGSYAPALEQQFLDAFRQRWELSPASGSGEGRPLNAFWQAIPERHWQFLRSLRWYYREPEGGPLDRAGYIFVHAGIDPTVRALAEQRKQDLVWQDTVWLWKQWRGPETLVVGHVSSDRIDPSSKGRPLLGEHMLLLDTGCPRSSVLSAVRLPDRTVFQARNA